MKLQLLSILYLLLIENIYNSTNLTIEDNIEGKNKPILQLNNITDGCILKYKPLISVLTRPEQELLIKANKANKNDRKCFDAKTLKQALPGLKRKLAKAMGKHRGIIEQGKRKSLCCLKSGIIGDKDANESIGKALDGFQKEQGIFNQANAKLMRTVGETLAKKMKLFTAKIDDVKDIINRDSDGNYNSFKWSPYEQITIVNTFNTFMAEKVTFDNNMAQRINTATQVLANAFTSKGSCKALIQRPKPKPSQSESSSTLRYLENKIDEKGEKGGKGKKSSKNGKGKKPIPSDIPIRPPSKSKQMPSGKSVGLHSSGKHYDKYKGSKLPPKMKMPKISMNSYFKLQNATSASKLSTFNTIDFKYMNPYIQGSSWKLSPGLFLKFINGLKDGKSIHDYIKSHKNCDKIEDTALTISFTKTMKKAEMKCSGSMCPNILPSSYIFKDAILPDSGEVIIGCVNRKSMMMAKIVDSMLGNLIDYMYDGLDMKKAFSDKIKKCLNLKDSNTRKECNMRMPQQCHDNMKKQCQDSGLEKLQEDSPTGITGPTECDTTASNYSIDNCFHWILTKFFNNSLAFKIDKLNDISKDIAKEQGLTTLRRLASINVSTKVDNVAVEDVGVSNLDLSSEVEVDGSTTNIAVETNMSEVDTEAQKLDKSVSMITFSIIMASLITLFI